MIAQIEKYSYLWTDSSWALLQTNVQKADEIPTYLIVEPNARQVLLVEDDTLYAQVKEKILLEGVTVVFSW